jgi:hypothetical protein
MHPSQIRRLIEALRSGLREIKDAAEKQERAIRDASKTADENEREIPRTIARAIESASYSEGQYESRQRDKEYRQQRVVMMATVATAIFTFLAFGAAAIYAFIANKQLVKMNATYEEMQKQTPEIKKSADAAKTAAEAAQEQARLMKQQLVGTQAASLHFDMWLDESTRQVGVVLNNNGNGNGVRARDIHLTWSIALVSIATRLQIGKRYTYSPKIDPLKASIMDSWQQHIELPWPIPSIPSQNENEVPLNWPGETAIKVFGTLSYNNGFGDRYHPESICKIWLPRWRVKIAERQYSEGGGLIKCDLLDATIRNELENLDKIKKAKQ